MKQTFLKLKWRIIAIHLFATFFLILAARSFSVLTDTDLVEIFSKYDLNGIADHLKLNNEMSQAKRIGNFYMWIFYFEMVALLISFLISWKIFSKIKISISNAFAVLLIGMVAVLLRFFEWNYIVEIRIFFRLIPLKYGVINVNIFRGLAFMIIGLLIFLFNWRGTKQQLLKATTTQEGV